MGKSALDRFIGGQSRALKIAFVHNKAMHYRIPLFKNLGLVYDISFLFFDEKEKKINYLQNNGISCQSVNKLRLIRQLLRGNYDMLITGDLIYPETYISFFLFQLLRKPIIIWSEMWGWPKWLLWRIFLEVPSSYIVKRCNVCIVPGIKSYEYLLNKGVTRENIFISSNPSIIPPASEKKINKIRMNLLLEDKLVLLCLARLVKVKGLEFLIKTMSKFQRERRDIILLIGGNGGKYKNKLIKLCKDLGLKNVVFLGWLDNDIGSYLKLADILVHPSIFIDGCAEAYGLVVVEAAMMGKPIITTTAVGAAYDLVIDGVNGFILKDKDPNALYTAINKLSSNPVLIQKMGISSRQIYEKNVSYEKMVNAFIYAIETAKK